MRVLAKKSAGSATVKPICDLNNQTAPSPVR